MARVLLPIAGAVVGGLIGGPAGAQMGWMAGSIIGGVVDRQKVTQEGPRLQELSVTASSYGSGIPRHYGAMRSSGNIIWATQIRETKNSRTESVGKGGGPEVTTVDYTYDVDLAVLLNDGQIDGVRKVWADGRLVYDVSPTADAQAANASAEFAQVMKVYLGTEDQLPDPTIEADKGVGNVPAYRGEAYAVFTRLALAMYGNRIPNLTFEVVKNGVASIVVYEWDVPPFAATGSAVTCAQPGAASMVEFRRFVSPATTPGYPEANPGGYYGTQIDVMSVDPLQVQLLRREYLWDQWNNVSSVIGVSDEAVMVVRATSAGPGTPADRGYFLCMDAAGARRSFAAASFAAAGATRFAKWGNYFAIAASVGVNVQIAVFEWDTQSLVWSHNSLVVSTVGNVSALMFCDDMLLVRTGSARHNVFSLAGGSYLGFSDSSSITPAGHYTSPQGVCWVVGVSGVNLATLYTFDDPLAGTLTAHYGPSVDVNPFTGAFALNENFLTCAGGAGQPPKTVNLRALTDTDADLADIVSAESALAGLSPAQVDATQLAGQVVPGFSVARAGSVRSALEPLMQAFAFDAAETGGQIVYRPRGGAVVARIPFDDLGASESTDTPDAFPADRANEDELPRSITASFANIEDDYQTGAETAQRIVTASRIDVTLALPMALSPQRAARSAEVMLFDAWMARTTRGFSTLRKWIALDPADPVEVECPRGVWTRVRLARVSDQGPVLQFQASEEAAQIYVSTAPGTTPAGTGQQIVVAPPSYIEHLDIPILRDVDDGFGRYVALSGKGAGWRGAAVYEGAAADTADQRVVSVTQRATIGVATTVLGAWSANLPDEINTVTVALDYGGPLTSATREQVMDQGWNACLLGDELLQFREASALGGDLWRLSGLLRGRRGTEWARSTHLVGERFVLIYAEGAAPGIARVAGESSSLNVERYARAVTFGRRLDSAVAGAFTDTGVGLKPFAPVNVRARRTSAGVVLTWDRRTRLAAELPQSGVDVPLGEATEAYEVVITNSSSGAAYRTLSTGEATATYTLAQQAADGVSGSTLLGVTAYQVSDRVGRGRGASITTLGGYLSVPQIVQVTLGGSFAAGAATYVQLGNDTFERTTLVGDATLAGAASALAALIDASSSYAASAASGVITLQGADGAPFAATVGVRTGNNTAQAAMVQEASPAQAGTRARQTLAFHPNFNAGYETWQLGAGHTLTIRLFNPVTNVARYYETVSDSIESRRGRADIMAALYQAFLSSGDRAAFDLHMQLDDWFLIFEGPVGSNDWLDVQLFSTDSSVTGGATLNRVAEPYVPSPLAQIVDLSFAGTPQTGWVYRATLGGVTYSYTATGADTTMAHIATGLAAVVDAAPAYVAAADGATVRVTAAATNAPFTYAASVVPSTVTLAATITQEAV